MLDAPVTGRSESSKHTISLFKLKKLEGSCSSKNTVKAISVRLSKFNLKLGLYSLNVRNDGVSSRLGAGQHHYSDPSSGNLKLKNATVEPLNSKQRDWYSGSS